LITDVLRSQTLCGLEDTKCGKQTEEIKQDIDQLLFGFIEKTRNNLQKRMGDNDQGQDEPQTVDPRADSKPIQK
jgi:hypothetical protein